MRKLPLSGPASAAAASDAVTVTAGPAAGGWTAVTSTKQTLLFFDPAALVSVSRPSATTTLRVASNHLTVLVGVPPTAKTPSTSNAYTLFCALGSPATTRTAYSPLGTASSHVRAP